MRFLDKYSVRTKRLLALEREAQRLYQAHWHAPIVPLEHPYQKGWMKTYVLDDRMARRPDIGMFRAMLTQINQRVYSRERSFLSRSGEAIVLRPRIICLREWMKLAWPASHQKFFGYGQWRLEDAPWTPLRWRKHITGFKLIRAWWLREDLQPHLITHQRVELPEVRARLAEIEAYMTTTGGWRRLDRIHGRSHWWRRFETTPAQHRMAYSLQEQLDHNTPD